MRSSPGPWAPSTGPQPRHLHAGPSASRARSSHPGGHAACPPRDGEGAPIMTRKRAKAAAPPAPAPVDTPETGSRGADRRVPGRSDHGVEARRRARIPVDHGRPTGRVRRGREAGQASRAAGRPEARVVAAPIRGLDARGAGTVPVPRGVSPRTGAVARSGGSVTGYDRGGVCPRAARAWATLRTGDARLRRTVGGRGAVHPRLARPRRDPRYRRDRHPDPPRRRASGRDHA